MSVVVEVGRADALRIQLQTAATRGPRIGISWNNRNARFNVEKTASLGAWGPILGLKAFNFIDLHYRDTTTERDLVQLDLGVQMTHLPDLDLTRDIDGLAVLISACDLVITVSNTTAYLAGALGLPT